MILNSENYFQTLCATILFIILLICVVYFIGILSVDFNFYQITSKDLTIMMLTTIVLLLLGSSFVFYLATTSDTISDTIVPTYNGPKNFISVNKE
jgi:hypothetical protein